MPIGRTAPTLLAGIAIANRPIIMSSIVTSRKSTTFQFAPANALQKGKRVFGLCRHWFLLFFFASSMGLLAQTTTVREGGENGLGAVTVQISSGYNVLSTSTFADGSPHSFHFAHPDNADQWMRLNTSVTPQIGAKLRFKSRLAWAGAGQVAHVQASGNGGISWTDVFTQAGTNSAGESDLADRVVNLDAFAGQTILIRFLYTRDVYNTTYSGVADSGNFIIGWFVDMIEVVRANGSVILSEGGENGLGAVTTQTSAGYSVLSTSVFADGPPHAFHLAHPDNADQWVRLNALMIPATGSTLRFKSRLAWAGVGQTAHAQVSVNGGVSWVDVYSQSGTNSAGESTFNDRAAALGAFAGQTIQIRFLYTRDVYNTTYSGVADSGNFIIGWFVDMIEVSQVILSGSTTAPPVITSPVFPIGTVGQPFTYQIVATNSPTSFGASGLPSGLNINSTTGVISGTPIVAGTSAVTVSAANAGGNATSTASLTVNALVNTAPTISTIAAQSTNEDTTTGSIAFTISDPETAATSLTVSASSSNLALLANSNIIITGSGANRTVTATPAPNKSGATAVTLTVSDGSLSNSTSFVLTVNAVNDAPSFAAGSNQAALAGSGPQTVTGWATLISAGPPDEAGQLLNFIVSNDNNALFSVQPSIAPNGTLTYTPAASATSDSAVVKVRLHDNGGIANGGIDTSSESTFTVVVTGNQPASGTLTVTVEPTNGGHVADDGGHEMLGQIQKTVGVTTTLVATPAPGFVFVGWNGLDVDPQNSRTVSFSMPQTLSLTAKFVAVNGTYNGLVQPTLRADRTYESSGRLQVTVGALGSYTGTLKLAEESYSIIGTINGDGVLGFNLGQMRLPSNLELHFAVTVGADGLPVISGTVSQLSAFTSEVQAHLAIFTNALNPPDPYRNVPAALIAAYNFTVSLPADAGIGSGRLVVKDSGLVSVFVTMPDGTKKLDSTLLEQDAEGFKVPIYVPFLQKQGSVSGVVVLPQQSTDPVTGGITWFKPADPNRTSNPDGWPGGIDLTVVGSQYVAPTTAAASTAAIASLIESAPGSRRATVILAGGGLPTALEIPTVIANNTLVPLSGSPIRRFSLYINPANGKFTGEFKHPITRKSNRIKGVVLQLQKISAGYFLGAAQSGALVFSKN
jgi:uncharacterized repeat protein (TIGR02543 family)